MKTIIYRVAAATALSACSTTASVKNTSEYTTQAAVVQETKSILSLLGRTPQTLGDADAIGALLQTAYVSEVGKIETTRRNFNLAGIMAQTYSAIGAGLQVHPHNLIISTALTGAIPTVATQFAPPKVEDAIVTASNNTGCIRRAITITLDGEFTDNIARLEAASTDAAAQQNLAKYRRLKGSAMAGYSRAYLSYVVARVPPALDKDALEKFIPEDKPTDNTAGSAGGTDGGSDGGNGSADGTATGSGPTTMGLTLSPAPPSTAKSKAETDALTAANASVKTAIEFAEKSMEQCFAKAAAAPQKPAVLAAAPAAGTTAPATKP